MKNYQLIILYLLSLSLSSCAQDDRYIDAFMKTKAYELAKAVIREDLSKIEKLVKQDATLIDFANPNNGSNVLVLSIDVEKYKSFEKLLELGANPNFINPYTKYSVLIEAIRPFGSQFKWRKDYRYMELLLQYGANPNYAVEDDFTNEKGHHVRAKSPLMEASNLDLDAVKILIRNGANPNRKLGKRGLTPFGEALESSNYEIINYFIDTLKVDIHEPLYIRKNDSLYIQDYIVNKFTKAKLRGDITEMERLKSQNEGIEEANAELWQIIKKLEIMGVDFVNYDYKL